MPMTKFIRARVADWEKRYIADKAAKAHMTESEFVRFAAVDKQISVIEGADALIKTDGRAYYHIVQAFSPDDPVNFETVHKIGIEFAEHFKGYQCLVATHTNTSHRHNHIVMNQEAL